MVNKPPTKDILNIAQSVPGFIGTEYFDSVVAIGGGAVIDSAKIISKIPITCYPTTAAGSSDTEHSVYWDGERKMNFSSIRPDSVIVDKTFLETLPEAIKFQTRCDLISHCIDSLHSKKANKTSIELCKTALDKIANSNSTADLVAAGRLGGQAIQITTTNLLHALSYPLTGRYGISHGIALSYLIGKLRPLFSKTHSIPEIDKEGYSKYTQPAFDISIDWDWVINEAYTYNKIDDFKEIVDKNILKDLL
jgi:alcohol dehydrogenase class IV